MSPYQESAVVFDTAIDVGYKFFRIPSLLRVAASAGVWLLAFCEGRQQMTDHGMVDIVLKKSLDDGATWSPLSVVHSETGDGRHATIGNPTPLYDDETSEIVLFFCRENAEIFSTRSSDAGSSWSVPKPIGWSRPPEWTWLATGPPAALILPTGRYVLPCDGYLGHPRFYQATSIFSFVLISDDRGATWRQGPLLEGGNECQAARLRNGTLLYAAPSSWGPWLGAMPDARLRQAAGSTCAAGRCDGCRATRTTAAGAGVRRGRRSGRSPTATARPRSCRWATAACWWRPRSGYARLRLESWTGRRAPAHRVPTHLGFPIGAARASRLARAPVDRRRRLVATLRHAHRGRRRLLGARRAALRHARGAAREAGRGPLEGRLAAGGGEGRAALRVERAAAGRQGPPRDRTAVWHTDSAAARTAANRQGGTLNGAYSTYEKEED